MNVNVDVATLSCSTFSTILKYFKCKQYALDCCNDEAKKALAYYQAANSDCELSGVQLDSIKELYCESDTSICAASFLTSSACEDTTEITLEATPYSCSYTSRVTSTVDTTAFPRLTLVDNSIYQQSKLNLVTTNCKGVGVIQTAVSGCSSAGCTSDRNPYGETVMVLKSVGGLSAGYLTSITLYATDANGNSPLTALTANISPSNLAAWTACGSCSAVSAPDLFFTAANFTTALKALIENVVKTTYGSNMIDVSVTRSGSDIIIATKIKHNPTSRWVGINPDTAAYNYYNGAGTTVVNLPARSTTLYVKPILNETTSIKQSTPITSLCGSTAYEVNMYGILHPVNTASTNINRLVIDNYNATNAYSASAPTVVCAQHTLSATYTSTGTVASVEWLNPLAVQISTTDSVEVSTLGEYTFRLETSAGCESTETITI